MECSTLRKRFQQLEGDRSNIENTYIAIEKFICPFAGRFDDTYTSEQDIDWRRRELFDSTAVTANQNLAANIHSGITSPVFQWFDFRFFDEELNKDQEAIRWLAECGRRVFYTLQQSNFNLEVNNIYLDLTAFGTGFLVEEVEEDANSDLDRVIFSGMPIAECFFEEDRHGQIVYFYRRLKWSAVQILDKFGDDTPDEIRKEAEDGTSTDKRHDILFAIYPRSDKLDNAAIFPLAATERPYGSKYIQMSDATMLGKEGGYYEMPVYVPRWRRTTGSRWGHSPGMICLSDVLTLNALVELTLRAAEKAIDPPYATTRRGVFGDLNLEASGVSVVASRDSLWPLESAGRFDVGALQKGDLQQSIRQTFFMDQLQMKESPAMTATEVQVRYELMQRLMGPTLNQLQYDFLDPLVQRTFRILLRYGKLPAPPKSVVESDGALKVEYLGPMARAQKADLVASVERWATSVGQLDQLYPGMKDTVKADDVSRFLGNAGGVPPELVASESEVTAKRKKNEKQMEQGQQMATMSEGASAMADMSQAQLNSARAKQIGEAA